DVVHHGRFAKRPLDGGERRLDARPGALAFETFDQPRLFTADVRPGAAVHVNVEVEALLAHNIAAEEIDLIKFVDRLLHHAITAAVFITNVDVRRRSARRIARDHDALQYLM